MKKSFFLFLILPAVAVVFFSSCSGDEKAKPTDNAHRGTIEISVDESFRPVMEEQVAMYSESNPDAHINVHYKTEADCLKDLLRDSSNRMVVVTRGLTDKEDKYLFDSLGFRVAWSEVASDAIAVIVNKNSADTIFTLGRLQQQLTGKIRRDETMVFDGLNQTSTVRFIEDSVLKGQKFDTSVVRAVKNSSDVLDYIASHPDAVGFVGINRIGNPEDTAQVNMLKKVKIAYVQCDVCTDKPYVFPSQESILNHRYPLVRGLYYIVKENYNGLGSGFAAFLKYERGQLIFRRAYLGPIMEFRVRDVKLNETLPPD